MRPMMDLEEARTRHSTTASPPSKSETRGDIYIERNETRCETRARESERVRERERERG